MLTGTENSISLGASTQLSPIQKVYFQVHGLGVHDVFFCRNTERVARFPSWSTSSQFLKMCCTQTTCILTSLSSKGNFYGVLTPSGNPCSQSLPFLIQCQQFPRRSLRPSPQPPIALPWFRSTLYLHPTSDLHQATNSKPSHLVCRSSPLLRMLRPVTFKRTNVKTF